jgi:hypothetical protein
MDTKLSNPVKRAYRRYLIELCIALAVYAVAMGIRGWLLHGPMKDSKAWQCAVVALIPAIALILIVASVVRVLRSTDEMLRQIQTESLAIAGGVTALLAASYGLLEGPNFPFLSAWWTYSVFMGVWLVVSCILNWRHF